MFALAGAFTNAGSVIQTRRLTDTETTSSIVFYFSLFCAVAGLATLPFGWVWPDGWQLAALIGAGLVGGLAHILLTESYRYAPASVIAPFDYTTMMWAFVLGYAMFGEVPTVYVYVGAAIVAGVGSVRDLARAPARAAPPARVRRTGERQLRSERLEGDDGPGVLDAGHGLHLLVHEVPDVGAGCRHRP